MKEGELEHAGGGFEGDAEGHLGLADATLGEDDRDFHEAVAGGPEEPVELDLEAITVGAELVLVDAAQGRGAQGLEAAGGVGEGRPVRPRT